MKRLIRHRWMKQPGFKIDKCSICGCVRVWVPVYGSIMYRKSILTGLSFFKPECKSTFLNDKI